MKKSAAAKKDVSKGGRLKLTKADRVYIGLDVHKRTIHVAVRFNGVLYKTAIVQAYQQLLQLLAVYRVAVDTYIEEYEHLSGQMRKVEAKQKELSGEKRHAPAVEILRSHPAVGPVTAIAFRTEVFSPERFKTGHQVSKYLGLDPVVRQSGEGSAKTIGISRAGRPYVRGLLVQAAWRWIKVDQRAAEFFRRVTSNTGNSKKAIVALARKLAVVLWTMLRNGELYRAA